VHGLLLLLLLGVKLLLLLLLLLLGHHWRLLSHHRCCLLEKWLAGLLEGVVLELRDLLVYYTIITLEKNVTLVIEGSGTVALPLGDEMGKLLLYFDPMFR
jgi:hypothetical protein